MTVEESFIGLDEDKKLIQLLKDSTLYEEFGKNLNDKLHAGESVEEVYLNGLKSKIVSVIEKKKPFEYDGTIYIPFKRDN